MAEERMLNDEILLGLIKANGGGGGGGTTNYNDLSNQPQINGVTLSGDKSASDLSLASLDANGKVPSSQLPSYVDDVINGYLYEGHFYEDSAHTTEITGESGKIYVDLETNNTYRWSGLAFVEISESLALGETASTAYAGDKGKANADAITAIKDGQTIDSFGDVETALSGKQGVLTAGDYVSINNNTIGVTLEKGQPDVYSYKFVTTSTSDQTPSVKVQKYLNGTLVAETNYVNSDVRTPVEFDGRIRFWYGEGGNFVWSYRNLVASNEHVNPTTTTWAYNQTVEYEETFDVYEQSTKLATQGYVDTALSGKQDTLTFDSVPTDGSTNPVESNGVYDALAAKQNATDNSLETTAKTIVGAINEHEGDIGSLKSGLTDLSEEVNGDATYPYADVITIEDAVPSNLADCKVKIEPVQDLHGYDKPWVGGANKNKAKPKNYSSDSYDGTTFSSPLEGAKVIDDVVLPAGTYVASIKMLSVPSTQRTLTFYKTGDVELAYFVNLNEKTVGQVYTTTFTLSDESTVYAKSWATGGGEWKMQMQLEAGETATSFAPYTNICPITGHTEASVQRTGENLAFDTISGKNINASGVIINADFDLKVARVTSGMTYTAYTDDSSSVYAFYSDSPASGSTSYNNSRVEATVSNSYFEFTAPIDGYIAYRTNVGYARTECVESSKNNQYTIALGDTIYGGTVDFDSGVMTVDRAEVDMGDLVWQISDDVLYVPNSALDDFKVPQNNVPFTGLCAVAKSISANDRSTENACCIYSYIGFVYVRNTGYDNASEFKSDMAGKKICYELATPTTIQLTPQQIQLLKGQNTLTASTGQISVTVNGVSVAIGQVQEQVNATDEALAELAEKLPTAPTTDGAYVLTVTVADGTPTYSWESAI